VETEGSPPDEHGNACLDGQLNALPDRRPFYARAAQSDRAAKHEECTRGGRRHVSLDIGNEAIEQAAQHLLRPSILSRVSSCGLVARCFR
jgi:hypothetical protein